LRDELAVEPGPTMRAAYEQLVASDVPPLLTATTPVTTSPLVGRKTEQARAHAIWQTAANGRPLMLALTGEAGLGKTRLAMEVLAWAGRQGVATAIAQCYAAEGDLAYAPVTAWLRSEAIRPRLAQLASVWLSEVARLAPEVLAGRPDAANPRPLTERWQRQRLFEALARAMLTGDRPLLLLIDDLPWCDRDTLEWLHFLLRYAPRARLLVLATLRPEEAGPDHPLVALMNDLRRSGQLTEMALMPLSPAETAELAEYLAGRTLAGGEASGLYAETEGNPLFVLETLRAGWAVQSAGAGPDTESPTETTVPPGVQSVIAQRLWQLTPEARELLDVAAVMGRSFNVRVLERAGGVAEAVLVRGLDELWQRRIVREQGTEAYDFSHDLLRQVVYSQLSPVRRRVLHRHVAEALEAEHASNLEAISGQLAAHYEHAGDGERAATYYEKAADAAQRVYANAEATGHLRRALKLLAPLTEPDQGARSAALAERLGDLLHLSGQYAEAREAYQHGLELVASERRQERANLRRKIGNVWRDQYCYDEAFGAYAAALAELSLSSDVARPELWQSWIQIQMDRFQTHYWLAQVPEMFGLVEALRPAVERYGSPLQRARISQMLWFASLRRDRTGSDEAVKYSAGYLEEVQAAGASDALPAARFQHGMALFLRGDLDLAEQEMLTALEVAQKKHDVSLEARCLTYLTIISRQRQRVEAVRDYAERSLLVATLVQMPDYIGAAAGNRAWIAWRSGDLDQAYAHGQQALTEWSQTRLYFSAQWTALWPLLAVALARGNIPEAVTYARALLDPKQYLQPQVLEAALTKAIHSVDAGDEAAARTALEGAQSPAVALGYL
ncbi:MAG: AAA family ATPase, partial [Armatimonadetes bacterium]|nr:AAA family ATPase [Armatimonadota bacterium]